MISEDRQERGERDGEETCSKGRHERDSNTRLAVRLEPICGMHPDHLASGRPPRKDIQCIQGKTISVLVRHIPEIESGKESFMLVLSWNGHENETKGLISYCFRIPSVSSDCSSVVLVD